MATFVKRGESWQAKVRRKGYPPVSKSFDTKIAAQKWARTIESEMDRGIFVDRTEAEATSLEDALDRYEREITPRKKGAKQEHNRIALWKRQELAFRSLASIRGADMAKWRDERLEAGKSSTTVRNDLALISHLFTVAEKEWGMECLTNPVRKIKIPSPGRARDRRLAPGEEKKLINQCEALSSPWVAPIVQMAIETAMRQGELLALRWENIDIKKRVAVLVDTKNGDLRRVPLSTRAITTLQTLPRSIEGDIFHITQDALEYYFRKAVSDAKLKDLRFHDLRHEATSRLFELGLNSMEVAAITGHKTLQMLKRYTHLRAEDLAERLG